MKKTTFLFLIILFSSNLARAAQESASPSGTDSLPLKDKIGFGIDYFDHLGTAPSVRFWLSDQTALDILCGTTNATNTWGIATGLKQNLLHPSKYVQIQVLERFSFVRNIRYPSSYYSNWTVLMAGTGFEAFMPFCEALSVEGWVGLEMSNYADSTGSWTDFQTVTDGLSVFNLGLHLTF